jgi:hypothetical protein
MKAINVKDIENILPKDSTFEICFRYSMVRINVLVKKDIEDDDLADLALKFNQEIYNNTVVIRHQGVDRRRFSFYLDTTEGGSVTIKGVFNVSVNGGDVLVSYSSEDEKYIEDAAEVEPTLTVHDIRGKLSPVTHLIGVLGLKEHHQKELLPNAILQAKKSVNYLAQRECYKLEENGE